MIKDPESEIAVSLNIKLGTGEGTILGGRMTSAKARILGKNCMCLCRRYLKKRYQVDRVGEIGKMGGWNDIY